MKKGFKVTALGDILDGRMELEQENISITGTFKENKLVSLKGNILHNGQNKPFELSYKT